MDTQKKDITVQTLVDAPLDKVWECWTIPGHIMQWNNASPDWHSPRVENDLKAGGKFLFRMEAKDGSMGFDFIGTYDAVSPKEFIEYTLDDGRKVIIEFITADEKTRVLETFTPENTNSVELQQAGWQSIMDNFKSYCEQQ